MKKKRKLQDSFDVLLYAMWMDCGNKKRYAKFKKALERASEILHERVK